LVSARLADLSEAEFSIGQVKDMKVAFRCRPMYLSARCQEHSPSDHADLLVSISA
jgi:hypothetical protein